LVRAQGCIYPGDIYSSVHASSELSEISASFTITSSIIEASDSGGGGSATLLPHGLISRNEVGYHEIEYYRVEIGTSDRMKDLVISATSLSGDVDLYVSKSWSERPRFENNAMTR